MPVTAPRSTPGAATTVVVATHNRCGELLETLRRLAALPERPAVIVVDNASGDGTAAAVRAAFPAFTLLALPANLGAAARNVGARQATTSLVAFSDDDSWWDPGALAGAERRFAADPALALVAARVLVGAEGELDPTSAQMAAGALGEWLRPTSAGPRGVTGFLACGAVVRRRAFLAAGGFEAHLLIGGEEERVALDLAAAGWKLVYDPDVVARHHPSVLRHASSRRRLEARNLLLTAWLRYPLGHAVRRSFGGGPARPQPAEWAWALRSSGWVAGRRAAVPAAVAGAFLRR